MGESSSLSVHQVSELTCGSNLLEKQFALTILCSYLLVLSGPGVLRYMSSGIVIQYFYLSVYSDPVRHLRELSFIPYGHPKTGTHT